MDRKGEDVGETIAKLCTDLDVRIIVIGLPLALDGTEGPSAIAARSFGDEIAANTGVKVEFYDERFTSLTADQALITGGVRRKKRKEKRDQVAAAVMLQGYLDRRRYDAGPRSTEDADS